MERDRLPGPEPEGADVGILGEVEGVEGVEAGGDGVDEWERWRRRSGGM